MHFEFLKYAKKKIKNFFQQYDYYNISFNSIAFTATGTVQKYRLAIKIEK